MRRNACFDGPMEKKRYGGREQERQMRRGLFPVSRRERERERDFEAEEEQD